MSREEFGRTFSGLTQVRRGRSIAPSNRSPLPTRTTCASPSRKRCSPQRAEQDALLASFPDLGNDDLDRDESIRHQSVLGLERLNDEGYAEFQELNSSYRERFGFPLVVSVRSATTRQAVLEQGWERMDHSPNQEHATALIEVAKIVNHRFDDLVAEANPIHTARTQRFDQLSQ